MSRKRAHREMDADPDVEDTARRRRPQGPVLSSRLLTLPDELKYRIYTLLLDDRASVPAGPYLGDHQQSFRGDIKYPTTYSSWRWPPLVWVSRQARNELMDHAGDRSLKRQTRAELDIMANGYTFFPTWISLPPDLPGEVPFDLDVTLRVFSGEAFRSNDGWPRQPGAGFRSLLTLLNQLVHEGPSFGHHFEILAGKNTWTINNLSVNVTFPDKYTQATAPETSRAIFGAMKALATDGIADGIIGTIHLNSTYTDTTSSTADHQPKEVTWARTYPVNPKPMDITIEQWRDQGFLTPYQRTLADDPRAPWDGSSGGASLRDPQVISPLPRRDSRSAGASVSPRVGSSGHDSALGT